MNANESHDWAVSLIRSAVLAPSSHNTQPWLFRILESAIDLYADRRKVLPINDPDDRELLISCGCALMNLRIAAAVMGLDARTNLLPAPDKADWLAHISFARKSSASFEEAMLAAFIEQRRTYRKRFSPREVGATVLNQLIEAAKCEGVWLRPLASEASRLNAASLVAEGDAAQWANSSWRSELAAWMHPRRRGDGLTVPALAAPFARFVVCTFNLGSGIGAKDRELAETSPLLVVLGTLGDQRRDWLLAGQALEHVLLVACRHGLQASYLNQPIQVASLRPKLQKLVGDGFPQILMSLGYPVDDVPSTPRRDVAGVIEEAAVQGQGEG